jgi:TonB family protein
LQLPAAGLVRENISTGPVSFQMEENTSKAAARSTTAGHLSVYVEGAHPDEVQFLLEGQPRRTGAAVGASAVIDVVLFVLLVLASRYKPVAAPITALLPENPNKDIIWLSEPGPGGGGGGGGNKMKEPPRKAELPGKDKITVPVEKPPKLEPVQTKNEPPLIEQLNIPAKTLASAIDSLPGAIDGPPGPPTLSQGSGSGGGAGTGTGSGIGPGTGSGLGPGSGGGTGGGVYRPGNGVTLPVVIREVKPQYTSDAMRAKVQGTVLLECVVRPDGSVGEVKVTRSLDSTFGLDSEAMKAARGWRFRPGTRQGEPVAVLVTIELTFTLR